MQLRHLRTFVAIADHGTLSAAARSLSKTQGAVSQDLRALEDELGLQLVDRSRQRSRITSAGRTLLPEARELLQRSHDIEVSMRQIKEGETGSVVIGALPSFSTIIAGYLAAFRLRHPGVRLRLHSELPETLLNGLEQGDFDIVVNEAELRDDLQTAEIGLEPLFVVVRPDDPIASKADGVTPEDFEGRPLVAFIRDHGGSRLAEYFFAAVGTFPGPAIEVDDPRVMRDLIRRGVGYGIMPLTALLEVDDLVALSPVPKLERRCAVQRLAGRAASDLIGELFTTLADQWTFPDPRDVSAVRL